ncbi:hypothetical protein GQ44DRAFT_723512 [Phaeosphaeriaceae sp. PMI808]|nr:hypothetical protein GQ44DRAFT_723512 [Phaeosphaeriaceae sp. PMI808]
MRFTTALMALAATAGLVAAQQKCEAQNIVDACKAGYQSRIDECNKKGNDYICLCDVYTDVLVCYNNCPNSNEKPPVQGQVTSYCGAAAPLRAAASASMASVASVAATQSKAPSETSAATSAASGSAAASATAKAFATGGAVAYGAPAGAAVVAFLGAAGLF